MSSGQYLFGREETKEDRDWAIKDRDAYLAMQKSKPDIDIPRYQKLVDNHQALEAENARLKAELAELKPKPIYLYMKVVNNPGHCPALVGHKFKDANLQVAFDEAGTLVKAEVIG